MRTKPGSSPRGGALTSPAGPTGTAGGSDPTKFTLGSGGQYAGVWSTDGAFKTGEEAGKGGLYDPMWGCNLAPDPALSQINAGMVAERLVAIEMNRRVTPLMDKAWAHVGDFDKDHSAAFRVLADVRDAKQDQQTLRAQAKEADLPEPGIKGRSSGRRTRLLEAALVVSFALPDVFLTAPALDGLNLSDTTLIGDYSWSDERHIAALGVVAGLLVISHLLGLRLPAAAWRSGVRLRATQPSQNNQGHRQGQGNVDSAHPSPSLSVVHPTRR
jgi:hypothetical protein